VHGRDVTSRAEMALDASGKVLAMRVKSLANVGAYPSTTAVAIQLLIGPWVATSIYDIRTIDFRFTGVLTNCAPTGAYRGAGRPEAIYITERLMDAAARELKIDGAELRRRNMIRPEQMPYNQPDGAGVRQRPLRAILDQGLKLADWHGYAARQATARRAAGCAAAASPPSWNGPAATPSRSASPSTSRPTASSRSARPPGHGPGHCHQLRAAGGRRASACRSSACASCRATPTAQRLRQRRQPLAVHRRHLGARGGRAHGRQGRELAADALEAPVADIEYREGRFTWPAPTSASTWPRWPAAADQRIFVDSTATVGGPTWPNGCHICEVESTPPPAPCRSWPTPSVNDIGRVISPPSCAARSTAARCRASARRCASASCTTPTPASCCRPASWTTRCRTPTASATSRPRSTPASPA
jgi:carbon-monoxide dehydrogenase large subunit